MQQKHRLLVLCAFATLVTVSLCATAFAQTKYVLSNLGTLGGTTTFPASINNNGQVAGYSLVTNGLLFNTGQYAFRTEANQPINPSTDNLGLLLGGTYSLATSINNSGQVAGYTYFDSTFTTEASVSTPGQSLLGLGTFTSSKDSSLASGINSSGQVVGTTNVDNPCNPGYTTYHAYVTTANGTVAAATDLGTLVPGTYTACGFSSAIAINDAGDVVGSSNITTVYPDQFVTHAFLSVPGSALQDLGTLGPVEPSTASSYAYGINRSGQIAGTSQFSNNTAANPHAFLTTAAGPMQDLGTLGGSYSTAEAINNAGQVTGEASTAGDTAFDAFLYTGGTMVDLNSVLPPGSPWVLLSASGINDRGQIVGQGKMNGEYLGYRLDPANVAITNMLAELANPSLGLNLAQQITTGLRVAGALVEFELGHYSLAITQLNAFIAEITSIEESGHLSAANATTLIDAAQAIIAVL